MATILLSELVQIIVSAEKLWRAWLQWIEMSCPQLPSTRCCHPRWIKYFPCCIHAVQSQQGHHLQWMRTEQKLAERRTVSVDTANAAATDAASAASKKLLLWCCTSSGQESSGQHKRLTGMIRRKTSLLRGTQIPDCWGGKNKSGGK